jgi:antitoxin VapB
MPLSIKNPEAEKLARALASETGESITESIIHALEERLERCRGKKTAPDLAERLLEISERCRNLPDVDTRAPEEILGYDERGSFDNGH